MDKCEFCGKRMLTPCASAMQANKCVNFPTDNVLRELRRVQALFQLRTLEHILGAQPSPEHK